MIIILTIGSLVLAIAILVLMLLNKKTTPKRDKDAERVLKELKNSMRIFEFPKENATSKEDVIDSTVDIFGETTKKSDKKESKEKEEKFYASQTSKNYHEKGCLALKRVKKKISGTEQYFREMKKKPCPICMPSEQ